MKVIGIQRKAEFRIDGKVYTGVNIFCANQRPEVEGFATEKFFINSTKPGYEVAKDLQVNDEIRVYFNRYGKVEDVVLAPPPAAAK